MLLTFGDVWPVIVVLLVLECAMVLECVGYGLEMMRNCLDPLAVVYNWELDSVSDNNRSWNVESRSSVSLR